MKNRLFVLQKLGIDAVRRRSIHSVQRIVLDKDVNSIVQTAAYLKIQVEIRHSQRRIVSLSFGRHGDTENASRGDLQVKRGVVRVRHLRAQPSEWPTSINLAALGVEVITEEHWTRSFDDVQSLRAKQFRRVGEGAAPTSEHERASRALCSRIGILKDSDLFHDP